MSLRDEYGIVSRNAEIRKLYGNRVTHGKVGPASWERPVTVVPGPARPKPVAPAPLPPRRGRNTKYGNPDTALSEMIKTAGAICNDLYCPTVRDRRMNTQSTIYLISVRARIGLVPLADMFNYADHTGAHGAIRAARDRLNRPLTSEDEEARQARIMRLVASGDVNKNSPRVRTNCPHLPRDD